mmetsp:Transcript_16102/g.32938  ORF Transcript_16102/g.32938 Transcript_16102/m.32938 type:complete len:252 (+) Transcript_16102:169-924(+)
MDSFNVALASFEAETRKEMRLLLQAQKPFRVAIRELEARISSSSHPNDALAAATIAQHSGLSAEDALHTLVPAREMQRLRTDVHAAEAANLLTRRLELQARPTPPRRHSTSPKPVAVLASVPNPPAAAAALPVSPAGSHVSAKKCSDQRARASPSTEVAIERVSLKRPRGSADNGGAIAGPGTTSALSEIEAGKERELCRQLSGLTGEINEAMRAGDRAKVVTLMRRRDQIRANPPVPVSGENKRGRHAKS